MLTKGETLLNTLNEAMPSSPVVDSVHHYLEHGEGETVTKTITLSASGATASENIFQLTGTVEIVGLHGGIVDATTLTNLTAGHFELYDSAAAVDLTKNDGVLSGMAVGTFIMKNAVASVTMGIANNVAGALTEGATGVKSFQSFFVTQKTGANTYIRFTYTTSDAPINAQIFIEARYKSHNNGTVDGTITAV